MQNILMVILLILGVGILIYPDIADWYHSNQQESIRMNYNEMVAVMAAAEIEYELERARVFNAGLTGIHIQDPFVPGSGSVRSVEYYSILNFDGIMGHIEIPSIGVNLPIRHGTADTTLARGAGHMENTPYPIGGYGNHSIITAHAGLVSMRLFTDVVSMRPGDYFFVQVLNHRVAYRVDFVTDVFPHEIDILVSYEDRDLITLVTCYPYGINTHRRLVRGERVEYIEGMAEEIPYELTPLNIRVWIIIGFAIVFAAILLFYQQKNKRIAEDKAFEQQVEKEYETLQRSGNHDAD